MKKLFRNRANTAMLVIILFCAGILIRTAVSEIYKSRQDYSGVEIGNSQEVSEKIRTGLKHRAYKLHISFRAHTDDEERIKALVDDLLEKALYESDDPAGGDYIRYQMGGYKMNYDVEKTLLGYEYRMELMPTYYSSSEQENYVDERVAQILVSMAADTCTDEEKTRKVHDLVTGMLSYDSVHKNNMNSHGKTTAYAALRYGQAVCQGYAVLCYRLLKELGVSCRIVTGDAEVNGIREYHAWLKVDIDGEELYMDPTLDDVSGSYNWFLKPEAEFSSDHWPERE